MIGYIPLETTLEDFKKLLTPSTLTGETNTTSSQILEVIRNQPVYDVDFVVDKVTNILVSSDKTTNCLTGNDTSHVVVTREILDYVIYIIKNGGVPTDEYR